MAAVIAFPKSGGGVQDATLLLSENQALTTAVVSTNVLNMGSHNADGARQIGTGTPIRVRFQITTAFAGGTSIDFQLRTDEDATIDTSSKILVSTGAIVTASLADGYEVSLTIPEGIKHDQYIGVWYALADTFSGGAVTAHVDA